jgi:type IV secretion system protein VirB2
MGSGVMRKSWGAYIAAALIAALMARPAFAGLPNLQTAAVNFQNVLMAVSVTVATIAILFIGYKMLWEHVPFTEVGRVAIACVILGGAGTIVSLFGL